MRVRVHVCMCVCVRVRATVSICPLAHSPLQEGDVIELMERLDDHWFLARNANNNMQVRPRYTHPSC